MQSTLPLITWQARAGWLESDRFVVRLLYGVSQRLDNWFTVHQIHHPAEGIALERALTTFAESHSHIDGLSLLPNIPTIRGWAVPTTRGSFSATLVYGLVLNGSTQRGKRTGDFKFIVVLEDELPDALITIFNLERTLTLETE